MTSVVVIVAALAVVGTTVAFIVWLIRHEGRMKRTQAWQSSHKSEKWRHQSSSEPSGSDASAPMEMG